VSTESLLESQIRQGIDRQFLLDALQRKEVRQELERYGVSRVEAAARINSLTDEEVAAISEKIKEMASGGRHTFPHDEDHPTRLWLYIGGAILAAVIIVVVFYYLVKVTTWPFGEGSFDQCLKGKSDHTFEHETHSFDEEISEPDTENVDIDSVKKPRPSRWSHEDTICQSTCYNEFLSCVHEVRRSGVAENYCDTAKSACLSQCSH